jgi:hypothetical protein
MKIDEILFKNLMSIFVWIILHILQNYTPNQKNILIKKFQSYNLIC